MGNIARVQNALSQDAAHEITLVKEFNVCTGQTTKKLSTKIRVKIVPLSCCMYERQNNSHRKIENRAALYVWFHFDLKKLTFIY